MNEKSADYIDKIRELENEIFDLKADRNAATITEQRQENKRLEQWVNDLQSGMYINCVYCGHRYGPNPSLDQTPSSEESLNNTLRSARNIH